MDIAINSLVDGARAATGAVGIIDVFRAFTTAAVAFANGASRIVMVGSVEEAVALRASGDVQVCMGEVHGRRPDVFDFGNSPFEVSTIDFRGKSIAQRTSAGTQGIVAASGASRLYATSLVIASATARALRGEGAPGHPDRITLVAMGNAGVERTDEDELCAIHIRNILQGRSGDAQAVRQLILAGGEAAGFRDPANANRHPGDLEMALDVDRYDFAIRVMLEDGRPVARMERHLAV